MGVDGAVVAALSWKVLALCAPKIKEVQNLRPYPYATTQPQSNGLRYKTTYFDLSSFSQRDIKTINLPIMPPEVTYWKCSHHKLASRTRHSRSPIGIE